MGTENVIGVWPDTEGERNADGSPKWIISLDAVDEQDLAESTRTLAVKRDRETAMEYARRQSAAHRAPIRVWEGDPTTGHYENAE